MPRPRPPLPSGPDDPQEDSIYSVTPDEDPLPLALDDTSDLAVGAVTPGTWAPDEVEAVESPAEVSNVVADPVVATGTPIGGAPESNPADPSLPASSGGFALPDLSSDPQTSDDWDPEHPFAQERDPETRGHLERMRELPFGYLRGEAGCGKSYLARRFAELDPSGLLVATTGIAAVNLGGTTINSTLGFYDTTSLQMEYEYGRLGGKLRALYQSGIRRLLVDEISMMDGNQLDIFALAFGDVNETLAEQDKPPMGMWLTGDFAQLPPVGAMDKKTKESKDPVLYAFQAKQWSQWGDNPILLTQVRRQADPDFIRAIQQIRLGDKTCVDYFRKFIVSTEEVNFNGTSILARNDEVDRYNRIRMLKLDTPEHTFTATRRGDPKAQPSEWKNIPETLVVKPGCLVMILANRREPGGGDMIYANGDLATYLEKISEHHARVRLARTGQDVVVTEVARERLKPGIPRAERRKEIIDPEWIAATITYMPLRVAYASTVHKSQGLSLDNVQVMINSQFWLSSGMVYVALSRARTPQGLRIVGTVDQFVARVRTNPLIKDWV